MKDYLLRSEQEIRAQYTTATSFSKFLGNAETALFSSLPDYNLIFYFVAGNCGGLLIKRRGQGLIPDPMVESFLYLSLRPGTWSIHPSSYLDLKKTKLKASRNWVFSVPEKGGDLNLKGFAQHQSVVGQLVIWDPSWMPPLDSIEANPIT